MSNEENYEKLDVICGVHFHYIADTLYILLFYRFVIKTDK